MKLLRLTIATLLASATVAFAQLQPGDLKVFMLKGDVKMVDMNSGKQVKLRRGMTFQHEKVIVTGEGARALILYGNGSTINISENSSVNITRFLQEPFDATKGRYLRLKEDPSTSDVLISVNYGQLVGKVKQLQPTSLYDVESLIGAAGVRGTTYLVGFHKTDDDKLEMKIGNLKGKVSVTSKVPAVITQNDQDVSKADFDPTATLSTGSVPEKSLVIIRAKIEDVELIVPIPESESVESFEELLEDVQEDVEVLDDVEDDEIPEEPQSPAG